MRKKRRLVAAAYLTAVAPRADQGCGRGRLSKGQGDCNEIYASAEDGPDLPVIFIVSGFVTVAPIAHASMTCARFDEFPAVSDPSIREQLETHVRALTGLKNYKIRSLDGRFFIVTSDGRFCKEIPRCEHRLLDLRNGVVRDVFAFRGTGTTWILGSPLSEYSAWAFVTTEYTFIRVDLPRSGDMIVIDSPGPEEVKTLQVCAHVR